MNTKRTKKINGVKHICVSNPNYIKEEGLYTVSCKKYKVLYYNETKEGWVLKGYCDTIQDFREGVVKIG